MITIFFILSNKLQHFGFGYLSEERDLRMFLFGKAKKPHPNRNSEMQTLRHLIAKDTGNACVVFSVSYGELMPALCSQHILKEYSNNGIVVPLELKEINNKIKNKPMK